MIKCQSVSALLEPRAQLLWNQARRKARHSVRNALKASTKSLQARQRVRTAEPENIMAVLAVPQKLIVLIVLVIHVRPLQAKLESVTAYAMLDFLKIMQLQVRVQCVQQGTIVSAQVPTKAELPVQDSLAAHPSATARKEAMNWLTVFVNQDTLKIIQKQAPV